MITFILICLWLTACDIGSVLICYQKSLMKSSWMVPTLFAVGILQTANWILCLKLAKTEREVYAITIAWDVLYTLVTILVPVIACEVRLNGTTVFGLVLMLIGLVCVRAGMGQ